MSFKYKILQKSPLSLQREKKMQALKSTGARSMFFGILLYNQKLTFSFQCKDITTSSLNFPYN